MASVGYEDSVDLFTDINEAVDKIQPQPEHVGAYQNQWQKPITDYGDVDSTWKRQMESSKFVGDIDFKKADWAESRQAVDAIMDLLLKQLREQAKKYEGLRIDSYIRQGSAREGLKVLDANEFDTLL
ncbi:uncharacterized protein LOC127844341 isoform X1 [Dreissena polymorpha]|uniref:Uncharacterized protein n=1 Tax=Dreissena polymorpha TaxID=45954 RepID=A0A9D4IJB6_DREPO|nr:uncharacterized protein LOC127844341 isoform X1 [Dreissena polymorpha]KAH3775159.1 hypothetical protein DPMN_176557 [Dreissena polymorpha]